MDPMCLILSGGTFAPLPEDMAPPAFVIACDRGWQYAERLGLAPDLVVGDFDSADAPPDNLPLERLPTRKDDTDTMYAARRAREMGFRQVALCCAFGGRLDHTLANLQTAAWFASHGGEAQLFGLDERASVFTAARKIFPRRTNCSLSLFALSDACEGVSLHGTAFDCADLTLTASFPQGVSNAWVADTAEISVRRGILMVLQCALRKGESL